MSTKLWNPTTDLDDSVAEFDSEFERLRKEAHESSVEHRTALHGCIGAIHRMREYRKSSYGSDQRYYQVLATDTVSSPVSEGVVTVRGKLEHAVVRAPMPESVGLFPGDNTFPGNTLTPVKICSGATCPTHSRGFRPKFRSACSVQRYRRPDST